MLDQKASIVILLGVFSQYIVYYFQLGLVAMLLSLVTNCGAFAAVYYSHDQEQAGGRKASEERSSPQ